MITVGREESVMWVEANLGEFDSVKPEANLKIQINK